MPQFLLALSTSLAPGHDRPPDARPDLAPVARTYDLAALSWADAVRPQGRRAVYRVSLDSGGDTEGRYTFYECVSQDEALRTVWFVGDLEDEEGAQLVEGTLRVLCHGAWGRSPRSWSTS